MKRKRFTEEQIIEVLREHELSTKTVASTGSARRPRTGRASSAAWTCPKRGFDPRDIGAEVFRAELQLVVFQLFGAPTKLAALQLLNDEAQPFDLSLRIAKAGALGCERADHPLQRLYIVRRSGKIDVYERKV
jgi:hypothetical protein